MSAKLPELDRVRQYVVYLDTRPIVQAEDVAEELDLKESVVERCFHFLNLEGLLSQAQRPHMPCASIHGWKRNNYRKTAKAEEMSGFKYRFFQKFYRGQRK